MTPPPITTIRVSEGRSALTGVPPNENKRRNTITAGRFRRALGEERIDELDRLERLDFTGTLLLYYRSGHRSEMALKQLTRMGHTDCWDIGGYTTFARC
jgi:rhodanese-related sulfurtransferase